MPRIVHPTPENAEFLLSLVGQISCARKNLSSLRAKNIPLPPSGKSGLPVRPILSLQEGRIMIVTKRGMGCGGRGSVGAAVCSQGGFRE
jgi:hypothetical protein